MSAISILITLLAGLMMFIKKRSYKLTIFIVGSICFDVLKIANFSFSRFEEFVSICFFMSELNNYSRNIKTLKKTSLIKIEWIVIIGAIFTIIFSPHLRSVSSIGGFVLTDLIAKYFIIIYSFLCIKEVRELHTYIRIIYICILVLTFFAVLNFILGYPIWLNLFGITEHSSSRLRLYGMFQYTFDYGFICIVGLLIFIYCKNKAILSQNQIIIGVSCCLFGVLLCGSRTVFVCGIAGVGLYFMFLNSITKNIRIGIGLGIVLIIAIILIPTVKQHLTFLLSAFDSDSDVTGSSLGMRITQYLTVLFLITDSPWFGKGYHYFFYDLGWSEGGNVSQLPYPELAGLEGAIMSLLLERGLVGVIAYLLFYIYLIRYALKLRIKGRSNKAVYITISILVSFILFGNMTGELNSGPAALLYAGLFLKVAYIDKYDRGCICYNRKL